MQEHTLVTSTISGRFALDDAQYGRDLSSGMPLQVRLGGRWIAGHVQHTECLYPLEDAPRVHAGYYFISDDGSICGLCTGMLVREVN